MQKYTIEQLYMFRPFKRKIIVHADTHNDAFAMIKAKTGNDALTLDKTEASTETTPKIERIGKDERI